MSEPVDEVEEFAEHVQRFATGLEREIYAREKQGATVRLTRLSLFQLTRLRWWVRIFQKALTEVKP